MKESLDLLLIDGVIDEVIGQLKTGKEAEVWLVRRAEQILAAKVYKQRHHRQFRNNAAYKEGRQVRNSRTARALAKGSRFGQAAAEEAWKAAESDALYKLHALGVRVPQPEIFYEGILLMEVVVDPEGRPAPRLTDAGVPAGTARATYEDLRVQVVRMLAADLIHGDLSPFNVLMAWNGPTIIDFPQVIAAAHNNRAEGFFKRDLENLRTFFVPLDATLEDHRGDADEIWRAYVKRELTPDFTPSGKPPPIAHAPRHGGHGHAAQGGGHGHGGGHAPQGQRPAKAGGGGHRGRGGGGSMPQVSYRGQAPAPAPGPASSGSGPPGQSGGGQPGGAPGGGRPGGGGGRRRRRRR